MKKLLKNLISLALIGTMLLPSMASADEDFRLYGNNRYDTNVAVIEDVFESAELVVVTSGLKFPDALSAYNVSKAYDAPIILMDSPSNSTYKLLKDLGTKYIIIIGGPNTVPVSLENKLKENYQVERIFGDNRYETNLLAYVEAYDYFGYADPVIVTGEHFQEPLIASSLASAYNVLMLLAPDMPRYCMALGVEPLIIEDSIRAYNDEVLTLTDGDSTVLAQVNSFPDSLSAVNCVLLEGVMINLVPSIGPDDFYTAIIGGPNTLKYR